MIYNEGLLDESDSVDASGGSTGGKPTSSGGKTSSGGGSQTAGGQNSGGAASDGGRSSGGEGGEKPTGSGGASSGGSTSGGSSSGGAASGGTSSGGAASGGAGTGGTPPMGPFLVTDMSKIAHSNSPFFGKIDRYSQDEIAWAADPISNMLVPRTTGSSDLVLHVAATFAKDGWGVDIAVSLKSGQAFNLSSYRTLTFELMGIDQETPVRIALEDYASHRGSSLCVEVEEEVWEGDDCDKHVEALATPIPENAWEPITLDLDTNTFDGCGLGCEREHPLDLTRIYAIHFKMDPPEDVDVDFSLDNIYIDN